MTARPKPRLVAPPTPRAPADLDDSALIAGLLARAGDAPDCDRAARALINRFGTVAAVLSADLPELARVSGAGPVALRELKLAHTLCERLARAEAARRPVLSSWSALQTYVRVALAEQPREQLRVLFLDRRNRLLTDEMVSHGTVDHAPVYPREVIRRALEVSASALILVHNHPSGDPAPSQADIEMTRQIVEAARVFALTVHDHLIVGREGLSSLRGLGLMG